MYSVTYTTMNDTYTKEFKDLVEAVKFVGLLDKLYPGKFHAVKHPTK